MKKDQLEFLHRQADKSFYPTNNIKRSQTLARNKILNTVKHIETSPSNDFIKSHLHEVVSILDEQASNILKLELYQRSIKHEIGKALGKEVNKHE